MVRNIDLPEALILYGRAVLVVGDSHETGIPNPRPGLAQLVQECHDIQTAVVVLLENEEEEDVPPHNNTSSLDDNTDAADRQWLASVLSPSVAKLCHMARQQLQPATTTTTHHSDNSSSSSSRRTPPPPNPAMLLDHVLERITVQPRPYGSASGYFGVVRNTLLSDDDSFRHRRLVEAKHCVVLATTLEQTRSARAVGMRVVSLLNDNTDNNNDTLADAVLSIDALEDYGVDDFATPGTFWLNPPQARDDFGNTVDPYQLKQDYNYYNSYNSYGGTDDDMSGTDAQNTITVAAAAAAVLDSNKDDDFGIDMKAILADLAPLKPKSMD